MKDEEMAEERATKFTDINYNEPDNYGSAKEIGYFSYHAGFLAGLKAGRPQWHDLRKDPKDLPKEVGNYIVCFLDTACERHTFELSFVDYFEDKHWIDEDNHNIEGYDEGVIAWCEIPTFDKE